MFVGVDANPDAGPNIFAALQKQLGLTLEAGKGIMKVLVVDSALPPTENRRLPRPRTATRAGATVLIRVQLAESQR